MSVLSFKLKNLIALCAIVWLGYVLSACSLLNPVTVPTVKTYTLDPSTVHIKQYPKSDRIILVQTPRAIPGFQTQRMVYMKQNFNIGYYEYNQWAGTPSDMLFPLITQALYKTGFYHAVVKPPYPSMVNVEVNTQILSFYQDFRSQPSHVHLRVVAQLINRKNNTVIATRDFKINQPAKADTPYAGVIAANQAVAKFLSQLANFCVKNSSRAQ